LEIFRTSKKLNWAEVVEFVKSGRLEYLGRLPNDEEYYQQSLRDTRDRYVTVGDYIQHREFGTPVERETDESSAQFGKLKVVRELNGDIGTSNGLMITFRKNDFPYALEDEIEHNLIWSTERLTDEQILQVIERERPHALFDLIYFVNTENLQSIKNIFHVHVLCRKKKRNEMKKNTVSFTPTVEGKSKLMANL